LDNDKEWQEIIEDLEESLHSYDEDENLSEDDKHFISSLSNVANFVSLTEYDLRETIMDMIPNSKVKVTPYLQHKEIIVNVRINLKTYLGFKIDKEFRAQIFDMIRNLIVTRKTFDISVLIRIRFLRILGWNIEV